MRKKFFLLAMAAMLLPLFASAANQYYDVVVNGIYYKLNKNSKEATVVMGCTESNKYGFDKKACYKGNVVIPETFSCDGVTYSVTAIEGRAGFPLDMSHIYSTYGAFEDCEGLSSVTIPRTIRRIGNAAFYNCNSLKAVYISDLEAWCNIDFDYVNIIEEEPRTNPLFYAHSLYLNGSRITHLVIPESITVIKTIAFFGCDISSVTFPKSVNEIYRYAFLGCTNLKDVYSLSPSIQLFEAAYSPFSPFETLHIRARYSHNYCGEMSVIYNWPKVKNVEYIEGIDYHLNYVVDDVKYKTVWYEVGEKVVPEEYPKKNGYTFSGWSDIPEIMPDHDVTVTGSFSANSHKLTYYVDGEEYKVVDVKYNEAITPESNPVKKGMTFSGWSNIPSKMPNKDVSVTGTFEWSKITKDKVVYQVTDTLNNYSAVIGGEDASDNITIASEAEFDFVYKVTSVADNAFNGCKGITSVEIPATITNIGVRAFAGIDKLNDITIYAEDVPNTDRTAFENSYIEDYVTLHVPGSAINKYKTTAPWKNFKEIVAIEGTASVQTYKLTYMVDGEVYETFDVNEGESITPESEPTKEGYTFSGWSEIPSTMPGNDVTVTGTFTINKYKLTYMIDGVEYKTIEVEYGSTITPEDNPTMDGYTFSGWSDIPNTMPASDVVVTGSFSKGSYTLTYILDGVTYKTYTYGYDESITPESVPDKEGYTFTGWDDLPNTMPGHDVTVTGSYTINKYKLIYMVDGEVYMTIEVEYGATITPEDEPTKDGYVFSGWSWIPSKMPAEDVTIIGTFKRVGYNVSDNIYIIDGNEATFAMTNITNGDLIISPTIVVNNTTYNVTAVAGYSCMNNTGITSVTIPDGVAVIGDNAFYGCTGVNSLSLGKDIGYIGNKAFAYIGTSASARKRASSEPLVIECHAESVPDVQNDSFEGIDMENVILKVDDDLVDAYKNLYPWSQFTIIVGFNAPTDINSIYSENNGSSIFSIDGRRIDKPQKGMNIIRTNQGTRKVMVK